MLLFKYKIVGYEAKTKEKIVLYRFALSKEKIKKEIKSLNLENVKIKLEFNSFSDIKLKGQEKLSVSETLDFLNNFYDIIKFGVSVTEAFEFLYRIAPNEKLKQFYSQMLKNTKSGFTLGNSLETSGMLNNYVVLTLKTAEKTGELTSAINELINFYTDKKEILGKIKNALISPAITMLALIGASLFLIFNVIPKIYGLFKGNPRVHPPSSTENLYYFGQFLQHNTFLVIGGIIGFILGFIYLKGHPKYGKFIYYIPLFKKLKKYEFQTEFLMTLYLLIKSGTNINTALDILKDNEQRGFIKKVYAKIEELYSKGLSFSQIVRKYPFLFDEIVGFMFEKGEKSGSLNETTEKLYLSYRKKIIQFLEIFPESIKMATLFVGGGILLYVFLGILQPVVAFTTQLG